MRKYQQRRVFHKEHVWYDPQNNNIYLSYVGIKYGCPMANYFEDTISSRLSRGYVYLGTLNGRPFNK